MPNFAAKRFIFFLLKYVNASLSCSLLLSLGSGVFQYFFIMVVPDPYHSGSLISIKVLVLIKWYSLDIIVVIMLSHRKEKKSSRDLTSCTICHNLLLLWSPIWPSYHVKGITSLVMGLLLISFFFVLRKFIDGRLN